MFENKISFLNNSCFEHIICILVNKMFKTIKITLTKYVSTLLRRNKEYDSL